MRIEQYFIMTDYSLWEVILNGYSPSPTRVVKGVLQPVAPTTAEQKLARKNELKAHGTFLMAFPDKHQLKFNSHKDAKTLIEAIEKRFGGNTETKKVQKTLLKQQYENFTGSSSESLDQIHNRLQKLVSQLEIYERNKADLEEQSLDDLFNRLKIYEAEVKSSSSTGTTTQNLAFVSSSNTDNTTESVSAVASVSVVCAKMHVKGHFARECRSPKDSRRNGAAEPQKRIVPVETSTSNALVSQYDGVGSYDWSFQAEEEPVNYALMAFSSSSSSSDNEVVSCSKPCSKAYAQLHSQYDKLTADFRKLQFNVISYQTGLESVEARLLVYKQNESVFEEDIKLLNLKAQLRDNALVTLRQKLEKVEQERDDLKLKFQPSDGYHAVPTPYTRTFMPPKPNLVFNTAPTAVETDHPAFNVKLSLTKPDQDLSHLIRPSAPIIEDWHVEISIPAATPKPASLTPTSNGKRRNRKACFVCKSLDHLIKDCDYHEKQMAQSTTRNHAHRGNHKQYALLTYQNPQKHMVPAAVLTQSKPVSITVVRLVSDVVPKLKVTRPRHAKPIIIKSNSPTIRHLTRSSSLKVSNSPPKVTAVKAAVGNPQHALKDKGVINSGCSRHMTGNMSYPSDFEELSGGYVAFGGNPKGGKIFGKGKIRTGKLDFDDVYFVKELKFNLFSVSQMCDKKNSVLFTDTECLVLSPDFKLSDDSQVLLRVPRKNNMYNVNLKNIIPFGDLTCLFAKATIDESNLWHRRLGHINFKTMNKLVKGNMVRGLPTKVFENDNTCVACKKGNQHRASCKNEPDETSPILKTFITGLENQLSLKVKVIRSDNGTEFKNNNLNQFCRMKVITREFSVPRTPQQNVIAGRKNKTLIEAARTMLADLLLPILFWTEAVNTAFYVQNRVLVTKPHNNTHYELLHGRTPSAGFMRPFGCHVTILNTLDSLGKFDGKVDEGFLVGYFVSSKAFKVLNSRTRIVQETLHVNFLENKSNVAGSGPTWLFDIDSLTRTMNYQPVTARNQTNLSVGFQDKFDAEKAREESDQQYVLFPVWSSGSTNPQNTNGDVAFNGKEPKLDEKKPESEVNVSSSSSAHSRKQDDKTKKKAKGKSVTPLKICVTSEYYLGALLHNTTVQDTRERPLNCRL
nr:hypothetical protein [Tanacetum cinerariifolium]